jgi:hypothetical protein
MIAAPVVQPDRLGLPCWAPGAVEATIRPIAQVDYESRYRFLACHAPIEHVRNDQTGAAQSDAEVFDQISSLGARENMVIVWGEPGTGKSHLINWLKLRFDHARAIGVKSDVLPVLIQRRTGSLRDALEQLVSQLPERFGKYLDPVRSAIERISEAAARQKMAAAMHLELGVHWRDRGKQELPRHIRNLPEAFRSQGFAGWLCRPGGVIDRNIQRLISPSDITERESIPEFTADEFIVQDRQLAGGAMNVRDVFVLIETFRDEPELAEEAAQLCNSVLRDALREVTGLGNAQLSQIFRSIRADLEKDKVKLALFIEDVSTLSVLDDEVINALEPQNDRTLCPLTAVVGMTDVAFKRLRDNQTQRGSLILSVGGSADSEWRSDSGSLDRFTARYLNALRLGEVDLQALAEARQDGSDVSRSACSGCPRREECHATFSFVDFEGVAVGLFPFVPGTPASLMQSLNERAPGVRRTQRGLLEHLVKPVLQHVENLVTGRRHPLVLTVNEQEPAYWLGFRETYAGGWPGTDLARLRVLAEFWTPVGNAEDAATRLQPLLAPFSLPELRKTGARPSPVGGGGKRSSPPSPTPTPSPPRTTAQPPNPQLVDLLRRLDTWVAGGQLQKPSDAQVLLLRFLRKALPLDDRRLPSAATHAYLANATANIIRIEDSATRPAVSTLVIEFLRNEATRDLIAALARHEYEGGGSWDFDQGQRHKRVVARWLRANSDRICAALDPPSLDPVVPVSQAVRFLALASKIRRRAALASDTATAVATVIAPPARGAPSCLSGGLRRLYDDLPERHRIVRDFLLREIDIPQGSGGCVIIDPWLVIASISGEGAPTSVGSLDPAYLTGFWKSRYADLEGLKNWLALPALLEEEQHQIQAVIQQIRELLRGHDYFSDDTFQSLQAFIADLGEVIRVQAETNQPVPDPAFEKLSNTLTKRAAAYAAAVREGERVAAADETQAVLFFDADDLIEAKQALSVCADYVKKVRAYADRKLAHIKDEGDPDESMERLRMTVDKVMTNQQPPSDRVVTNVVD